MNPPTSDDLNDLLIDLGRCLLQYVGEAWPWTSAAEAVEQSVIDRLVAEQKVSVVRLAEWLDDRGHLVTYGSYPTEYTSLHYVALDYLLGQLVEQQRVLAEECAEMAQAAVADYEAEQLLTGIAGQAARHLEELRQLAAGRAATQPA